MASSDELEELLSLYDELQLKQAALGEPPSASDHSQSSYLHQRNAQAPFYDEGAGEGQFLFARFSDPYERDQAAYDAKAKEIGEIEEKIRTIRAKLSQDRSMPLDPIRLGKMAALGHLKVKTLRHWPNKPRPAIQHRGKIAAVYSYAVLRAWFIENRPDMQTELPASYEEAIKILS